MIWFVKCHGDTAEYPVLLILQFKFKIKVTQNNQNYDLSYVCQQNILKQFI